MSTAFLHSASQRYAALNGATLRWLLARPALHGRFLNTKFNSVLGLDRPPDDRWRGPNTLYGWIQGRGLEALVLHARDLTDRALAEQTLHAAHTLYQALSELYQRDGHGYFTYDDQLRPVYQDAQGNPKAQFAPAGIYTYSDIFLFKGLFVASQLFEPAATQHFACKLLDVAQAVEQGAFVSDERQALTEAVPDRDSYGPHMILLGAAALLRNEGEEVASGFGERFIQYVLEHHLTSSGLLADQRGGDLCNIGHALEFVGFSLEYLGDSVTPARLSQLQNLFQRIFETGMEADGLPLIRQLDGQIMNPLRPWWSLPEAIRAAAQLYQRTGDPAILHAWQQADDTFFRAFWRPAWSVAYQMRDAHGPVDVAPATPDLDPGYHTGLSLRTAGHCAQEMLKAGGIHA